MKGSYILWIELIFKIFLFTISIFIPGQIRITYGWLASFILSGVVYFAIAFFYFARRNRTYLAAFLASILFLPLFTYFDNRQFWYPYLMPTYMLINFSSVATAYFAHQNKNVISLAWAIGVVSLIFISYNNIETYLFENTISSADYSELTTNGKTIELDGVNPFQNEVLNNKIVIVDFWYTTCAPCITKLSAFDSLANKYADHQDVVFLSVVDGKLDSKEKVSDFMKKHKIRTKVLYDSSGIFISQFALRANGYPLELRINKSSQIWEVINGYTNNAPKYVSQGIQSINTELKKNRL
ncbi:redoxin domain-containing protein [Dyadobacter chenwenxiniae]|uniref:Redoxin domain-containing protein n=1 Tax=Dyadobacter chenwenxiniae TaxID=2906456 RepID=A0A9X1TDV0_9BACT|nr:TlpA disulfide reductase family protein [Dyadobacter chenwenxiniae]MCF0061347.1 redoxin domain-containing protein [Dyadobacter chenwenxiniae]UON81169.1 redoxin domain-containing protein [Dyadobacter chenwenxiniae]